MSTHVKLKVIFTLFHQWKNFSHGFPHFKHASSVIHLFLLINENWTSHFHHFTILMPIPGLWVFHALWLDSYFLTVVRKALLVVKTSQNKNNFPSAAKFLSYLVWQLASSIPSKHKIYCIRFFLIIIGSKLKLLLLSHFIFKTCSRAKFVEQEHSS